MYSLKKILQEIGHYKKELILGNFVAILATLLSIPLPLFIPLLIDEILLKKSRVVLNFIDNSLGKGSDSYYIFVTLLVVLFLRILHFIFQMWQTKIFKILGYRITYNIRKTLLMHLQRISVSSYESIGSGTLMSYMITDINTIDEFIGISISRFSISILTLLGVGIVLLKINLILAIFIFALHPLVYFLTSYMAKRVAKLKKKQNQDFSNFQENLSQTLEMFIQIKAANKEKNYFQKTAQKAQEIRNSSIQFGYKSDIANRLSFLVFMNGYEIFRAISILLVLLSSLSLGMMLAVFNYIWVIMTPFQDILNFQYALHNAKAALEHINQILALPIEPTYLHHKNPFHKDLTNGIELQNIFFSHQEKSYQNMTLENISLTIQTKKYTAIVGSSGSGKSTLAQILVGFYVPQKGKVLYNGMDVQEIGLDVIRNHIALIPQSPTLFNDTLLNNLTMDETCTEKEIWQALEISQIKKFVHELPQQLQTKVGKNGTRLSGGQKQRIAMARMILAKPEIVILDESTSALDVETEEKVFSSLINHFKNKTLIIIAHRLSTIRQADFVFVLESGKIVERGKPHQLIKQQGYYSSFVQKQK